MIKIKVLCVGKPDNLLEILQHKDAVPVECSTINDAVHTLANKNIGAVVINRRQKNIDVLELILNLRDIDSRTPIMVVDDPYDKHYEREMVAQPGVHYLATEYTTVEKVLDNFVE